jgi:uncharacterized protein (TIGR00369 family)
MSARSLADLVAEARATRDFSSLVRAIPFATFLGLELLEEGGELRGRVRFAPHLIGNPTVPALHGGSLGAVLESIAIFAILMDAERPKTPKTISITIDYLRSARPTDTFVRAEMVRHGRRVATVRAIAWQDDPDKPVATANVQLLLPRYEALDAPP